jgi:hypothetical protein
MHGTSLKGLSVNFEEYEGSMAHEVGPWYPLEYLIFMFQKLIFWHPIMLFSASKKEF